MDLHRFACTAENAPHAPGLDPTWCHAAKEIVGCGLGWGRVWFTVGGGILNEVYYPRVDIPQIRDLGFIIADDAGFWVELKRLPGYTVELAAPGIPAVIVTHRHARFEFRLHIAPDSTRDVLLMQFELRGDPTLKAYALLAPHLGGSGYANDAEVGEYRGRRVLWAEQGPFGLALAAVDAQQKDTWQRASAGYVGFSDGWQDFAHNGQMRWQYRHAGPGNVALMGELPATATLALAFAASKDSAATLALSALAQPFEEAWQQHIQEWQAWHGHCRGAGPSELALASPVAKQFAVSAMVLRVHQDKIYPGAMVASLSIPWGNTRDERGGYHLVWPRDLVESAGALLALGATEDARDILRYLIATQHSDGHWFQNQWLGGKPYWGGVQLDEAAFPVLLATTLADQEALNGIAIQNMVQRALSFIVRNGPATQQDRWEEDAGINTFTVAICIAALVSGAACLPPPARALALALADYWNAHIEEWTVAYDTDLARRVGVRGYYVRIAPPPTELNPRALLDVLPIKNRLQDPGLSAAEQVGNDFLQLVRFGLRRADDPLIVDSVRVMDALLKTETPSGPAWYRYNGDGYGEHEDGAPFNGAGVGRPWPLLSGERGHYELALGKDPLPYLESMCAMAGDGGMLPEQIWDSPALPEHHLFPGRATGSAMPLAWAHAEFIKLTVSRQLGQVFDRPQASWARYGGEVPVIDHAFWLPQAPIYRVAPGTVVYIGSYAPVMILWSGDGWHSAQEQHAEDSGLGLYVALLQSGHLLDGARIDFTFRYANGEWLGRDYKILIAA